MAPVSIIFGPQNCSAVAQKLPATGRLQDGRRLFGYFSGFWLQSDRSPTDSERVGASKFTRLRSGTAMISDDWKLQTRRRANR
jgi:hypothetical protein